MGVDTVRHRMRSRSLLDRGIAPVIGNRLPRKGLLTGRPSNRAQSESIEKLARVSSDSALKVEAASQASAEKAALGAAVPSDLQAKLDDYESRLIDLETP